MGKPGRKSRNHTSNHNKTGSRNLASNRHKTGKIVLSAIKKLMKNTGWTARTIVKFIKMEYAENDPHLGRKVSRALKRGVKLGLLHNDRGRYRLNMSALARTIAAKDHDRRHHKAHREQGVRIRTPRTSSTRVSKRRKVR